MKEFVFSTIDDSCEVEYGTRVVQKRDAGYGFPVYGGGGATFQMDTFNRENRIVVSRFGISKQCTRWVEGKFFLNDSGLTLRTKDSSTLSQEYLDFLTLALNDEIYATAKGTAQKNVEMPSFRRIKIAYPNSLDVQKVIVEEIKEYRSKTDALRLNFSQSLKDVDKLEKSILISKMLGISNEPN
jgi:type I restriction enzyme S subunit